MNGTLNVDMRRSTICILKLSILTESGYINATKFCSVTSGGKKMIIRYKDLIAEYTEGRSLHMIKFFPY